MASLNLRDVDDGLMKALRVKAAEGGLTLRGFCVGVLSVAAGWRASGESTVEVVSEVHGALKKVRVRKPPNLESYAPKTLPIEKSDIGQIGAAELDDADIPSWEEMEAGLERLASRAEALGVPILPPPMDPEVEMCDYREYDGELGEWFGCRLAAHSKKVKHQRGEKING